MRIYQQRFRVHVRIAAIAAALALVLSVGAISALAGRPSSATLNVPDGEFGEMAMATVDWGGGSAKEAKAAESTDYKFWRLLVQCYQDDERVYKRFSNFDGTYSEFPLGPTPLWRSGAAECTADLGYFFKGNVTKWRTVTSAGFSVTDPS